MCTEHCLQNVVVLDYYLNSVNVETALKSSFVFSFSFFLYSSNLLISLSLPIKGGGGACPRKLFSL